MDKKKRERSINFTNDDKLKLISLLKGHNIILSKQTNGAIIKAKDNAWLKVAAAFNATNPIKRSLESLKKMFNKLKANAKVYRAQQRIGVTSTGGGKNYIKDDPILDEVLNMIGRGGTGILGVQDCDDVFNSPQEEEIIANMLVDGEEVISNEEFPCGEVGLPETVPDENCEVAPNKNCRDTPSSSNFSARRRPILRGDNLKIAQLATEEKKRELLEGENRRAEELHLLIIRKAQKDIEIKDIVLQKLKNNEELNPAEVIILEKIKF